MNKSLKIGFSGAHRTGKTITAIEVAKHFNIEYINARIGTSTIWSSIKPSDAMTFAERIQIQEILLDEFETILQRNNGKDSFVIDRTPVDILAYLLTNIDHTTSNIFDSRTSKMIERCIDLSAFFFTHCVVIPPGIPFVSDANKNGKVYNSKSYQESLTNMIVGIYMRYFENIFLRRPQPFGQLVRVPEDMLDLRDRVQFITNIIEYTK